MDRQALATRVARGMYARDFAAQRNGVEILEVGPGFARLAMTVRREMLNGHGLCHGGYIFFLADTAFAYACNADNHVTVALACHISFVAPAREGERLVAVAREVARAGRTGVFDVTVMDGEGRIVASFRGNSYRTRGQVVEVAEPQPA
ncbi:MAG TPA: hydroxyphenylacetyl-CoA thioesterase PaaI [Rhodospirillales bacterium]|nr:hydroxyphenylacetyl-CoA thioesterase PaaI [Rhodospirillales bacterium]